MSEASFVFSILLAFYENNRRWGPVSNPLEVISVSLRSLDLANQLCSGKLISFLHFSYSMSLDVENVLFT